MRRVRPPLALLPSPLVLHLSPLRPDSVGLVTGHPVSTGVYSHLPLLCFRSPVIHTHSIFTWQETFAAVEHRCVHRAEYHAYSLPLSWSCVARNCDVLCQPGLFLPITVCCLLEMFARKQCLVE